MLLTPDPICSPRQRLVLCRFLSNSAPFAVTVMGPRRQTGDAERFRLSGSACFLPPREGFSASRLPSLPVLLSRPVTPPPPSGCHAEEVHLSGHLICLVLLLVSEAREQPTNTCGPSLYRFDVNSSVAVMHRSPSPVLILEQLIRLYIPPNVTRQDRKPGWVTFNVVFPSPRQHV